MMVRYLKGLVEEKTVLLQLVQVDVLEVEVDIVTLAVRLRKPHVPVLKNVPVFVVPSVTSGIPYISMSCSHYRLTNKK